MSDGERESEHEPSVGGREEISARDSVIGRNLSDTYILLEWEESDSSREVDLLKDTKRREDGRSARELSRPAKMQAELRRGLPSSWSILTTSR